MGTLGLEHDQLKDNIRRKIQNIPQETFPKVMENMAVRICRLLLDNVEPTLNMCGVKRKVLIRAKINWTWTGRR
jgi:hypothetical protein